MSALVLGILDIVIGAVVVIFGVVISGAISILLSAGETR